MPTARAYATCGVVDGKLYVLGGLSNCNATQSTLANLDVYDPATDSWTQRAPSVQPQFRRPVASVNGQLYLVGSSGDLNQVATNSLDRYDPGSNTWSSMPAMATGRIVPAVCSAGTSIYVFGGFARSTTAITPLASVEVFDTVANIGHRARQCSLRVRGQVVARSTGNSTSWAAKLSRLFSSLATTSTTWWADTGFRKHRWMARITCLPPRWRAARCSCSTALASIATSRRRSDPDRSGLTSSDSPRTLGPEIWPLGYWI